MTLRIVDPPRLAWLREWDCTECGHETLRHPVFVSDSEGVGGRAVGTGCAARLLGRPSEVVRRQRDTHLREAQQAEDARADRAATYRGALAEWRAHGLTTVGSSLTVPRGPGALFDALRLQWGRHDAEMFVPASFGAYLEAWLADNDAQADA